MTRAIVKTFCRVCEPACGLVAEVEGGRLARLMPDREHPVSKGYACHKGLFGVDIHHDPDRLNHPQRRNADGSYTRVTWDAALSDIGARLSALRDRHGPAAIAGYLGNPGEYNARLPEAWYGFFGRLGTDRLFNVNTQDCGNKFAGSEAVFGSVTVQPIPDVARTKLLILIGENPKVSQMSFMSLPDAMGALADIEARGGAVVFVNPRRVESAQHLGEWLPIRPDTDVYFLAAFLHELDRLGFSQEALLARHGRNVAALRRFIAAWPPARVAEVTGIPAERITDLAQRFGGADGAAIHLSTGVNMGRQGTLAYWLMHMVSFVTGNLDRPGGNVLSVGYYTRRAQAGRARQPGVPLLDTPWGPVRQPRPPIFPWPGNLLPELITEAADPIRALIVCAGNPVLSMGGEARLRAALPKLELLVVVDLYRNATGEYAHYLLPATDAFERDDLNAIGTGLQATPYVQYTEAVVAPQFERRHEQDILQGLAAAMGLDAEPPVATDPWGKFAHMMRSRGVDFAELRQRGVITFPDHTFGEFYTTHLQTEDQRVDCCPPAFAERFTTLETQFAELAATAQRSLKLISLREARMMNSWYSNLPRLRTRSHQYNPLHVHPEDAARLGLVDDAEATLVSPAGEIAVRLRLDADLLPGVVAMTHGWGQAETSGMRVASAHPGVNCNQLLPTGPGSFDPLSGQAHMTGIPVELRPRVAS